MDKQVIIVKLTTNYGNQAIYPVCETAHKLLCLTGKKTFSKRDIAVIESLGYLVKVEQPIL